MYGYKFGAIAVFHCSVIMKCFQNFVSDLGTFLQLYVQIKTGIEFALSVRTQRSCIPNLGHLLLRLQSMKGISIGN